MFKGTANITTYLDKLLWYCTTLMLCLLTGTKVLLFFLHLMGTKLETYLYCHLGLSRGLGSHMAVRLKYEYDYKGHVPKQGLLHCGIPEEDGLGFRNMVKFITCAR